MEAISVTLGVAFITITTAGFAYWIWTRWDPGREHQARFAICIAATFAYLVANWVMVMVVIRAAIDPAEFGLF